MPPPTAPAAPSITEASPTSLRVSWPRPLDDTNGTFVYRATAVATKLMMPHIKDSCKTSSNDSILSCAISGLLPDTTYTVTVIGCSHKLCSSSSAPTEVRTLPGAPTHIRVGDLSATSANVSWTWSPGPHNYQVTVATGVHEKGMSECTSFDGAHCMLTGMHPDTVYNIYVVACSVVTVQCSLPSEVPITVKTLPTALNNLQVSDITSVSFTVARPTSEGIKENTTVKYHYFATTADGANIVSNCTIISETQCILAGLHPDTLYNITRVTCSILTEECTPALIAPISVRTYPAAPTHIQVTDLTETRVNVSWTWPPGVHTSQIIVATAMTEEIVADCASFHEAHCMLIGLHPDTAYNITVVACSVATVQCSPPSLVRITVKTLPAGLHFTFHHFDPVMQLLC
ncbi:unnamed protein product [Dibothriocephalus latus]|uniref:Fibronectin type-III domain-containing protein n=1 Tax=Dibothriocephalus latus TaxID=60516 RepID=A0A3P7L445_DIBLA|nr:unnamed protein product [Dibothriocephalus latus]